MACISEISDGRPHWMRGWADPASLTSPVKEPSDEEDRGYDHDPRDMNRTGDFANEYPDLFVGHDDSGFWIGFIGGLPNAAVQAGRASAQDHQPDEIRPCLRPTVRPDDDQILCVACLSCSLRFTSQ